MITRTFYIFYPDASGFIADASEKLSTGYFTVPGQKMLPVHYRVVLMFMLSDGTSLAFSAKPTPEEGTTNLRVGFVDRPDPGEWSRFVQAAQQLAALESGPAQPPKISKTQPILSSRRGRHIPEPEQVGPADDSTVVVIDTREMHPEIYGPNARATAQPEQAPIPRPPKKKKTILPDEAPADQGSLSEILFGSLDLQQDHHPLTSPQLEHDERQAAAERRRSAGAPVSQRQRMMRLSEEKAERVSRESGVRELPEFTNGARELPELSSEARELVESSSAGRELPLAYQLKEMSVTEKRKLARQGGREARNLLIRDTNKTLHLFVVKNPQITLDEVRAIARMTNINPEVFRHIADNPEYKKFAALLFDMVKNPSVPMDLALRLVHKLKPDHWKYLARGTARMPIVKAARDKLFK